MYAEMISHYYFSPSDSFFARHEEKKRVSEKKCFNKLGQSEDVIVHPRPSFSHQYFGSDIYFKVVCGLNMYGAMLNLELQYAFEMRTSKKLCKYLAQNTTKTVFFNKSHCFIFISNFPSLTECIKFSPFSF